MSGLGGTIVCGLTVPPDGNGAAELAEAISKRLDLRLVLVHVVDGVPRGAQDSLTVRQRRTRAERALESAARAIGDGTERRVVLGSRAEALAQVAAEEGADMIVLGSRPAGFGNGKLRCSLARDLEASTPVPVLVAPPATRKRSDHRLYLTTSAAGGS